MHVRIKVCGFTCLEDVALLGEHPIDAVGFNFASGPRRIDARDAAPLVRALPPFVQSVALFVDADLASILEAMRLSRCHAVQLHGNEPPELAYRLTERFPVIKALRVRDPAALRRLRGYPADCFLLDGYVPGTDGGTGQAWDYSWLRDCDLGRPLVLAGGLRPDNVAAAIDIVRPAAVDVASGVESSPGRKDPARLAAFVAAVRPM